MAASPSKSLSTEEILKDIRKKLKEEFGIQSQSNSAKKAEVIQMNPKKSSDNIQEKSESKSENVEEISKNILDNNTNNNQDNSDEEASLNSLDEVDDVSAFDTSDQSEDNNTSEEANEDEEDEDLIEDFYDDDDSDDKDDESSNNVDSLGFDQSEGQDSLENPSKVPNYINLTNEQFESSKKNAVSMSEPKSNQASGSKSNVLDINSYTSMNQQSLKPNVKSSSLPKNLYQQNGLDPKSTIASPDTIKNSREQVRNAMAEIHKQKEIKRIASNANQDYSEYGSSLEFRSGYKLEDLAIEAMIPEIRRWIDSNLEKIVREVVEDQVKQILSDS